MNKRTPEQIAEDRRVREFFEDYPSLEDLIDQGEIDPDKAMPAFALIRVRKLEKALRDIIRVHDRENVPQTQEVSSALQAGRDLIADFWP